MVKVYFVAILERKLVRGEIVDVLFRFLTQISIFELLFGDQKHKDEVDIIKSFC